MPTNNDIHVVKAKAKAKSLLKSVRAGDADALQMIRPYFQSDEFKLTQAQLVIARMYQCRSWKELVSKDDWIVCSFCSKSQLEVRILAEGGCSGRPRSPERSRSQENCVFICDECVDFCAQGNADVFVNAKEARKI